MFEQCKAEIKPPGATRPTRCPAPALPGQDYCPLHMVLAQRGEERQGRSMMVRLGRLKDQGKL
jgi:hypothetical protein